MSSEHKKKEFSLLFDQHYSRLYNYAFKMLKDNNSAEEVVQETFIKLWENIEKIKDKERSIAPYLIVTLKNKIIDTFRKNKTREKQTNLYAKNITIQENIDNEWEILQQIDEIYATLPATTLEIFRLSRDKGLTYKEISAKNNISIKTVESHISKALAVFRKNLKDYL